MKVEHITTDHANILRFDTPMRVVSSAPIGGGVQDDVRTVANWSVDADDMCIPTKDMVEAYIKDSTSTTQYKNMVVLFTAVPSQYCKNHTSMHDTTGLKVYAYITAGLGNRRSFQDPDEWDEEKEYVCTNTGTINSIVVVNRQLTTTAHIELHAMVAQIKTHIVESYNLPSPVSGMISSGTGTDCIAVCAPMQHTKPPLRFAGMYTTLAHITQTAVAGALNAAIENWMLGHPDVHST